ncbi:MAG: nuclear transport factor 2 family protein [Candidatus Dormibacteraeota bacterium]|nr:nuclear transport factor 2 family protein [Candidatus Dormibacteraeota bacterium]
MPLTKERVAAWLADYVRAWDTYDSETIGSLFTEDATYAYHPFEEPVRGRLAIVASWLENKDAPGTYDGHYDPIAIDGDLAVAHGRSRYFKDASRTELDREYDNLFLIRFDDEGRCQSIREWYMAPRGQKA